MSGSETIQEKEECLFANRGLLVTDTAPEKINQSWICQIIPIPILQKVVYNQFIRIVNRPIKRRETNFVNTLQKEVPRERNKIGEKKAASQTVRKGSESVGRGVPFEPDK
jgi:hypothetical protein